jgi:ribonuclease BN (tRNA processing enzyme)
MGILARDIGQVLLSHHHPDHMDGLLFLQFWRTQSNPEGPPLRVYSTEEALEGARKLCLASRLNLASVDQDGAFTAEGRQVFRWDPTQDGQWVQLGATTRASAFSVDHISGAVGWRVECGGMAVVFSGDTRFSPNLVEASRGARLLIHEAFCTEADKEYANAQRHSTGADAGRAAAQAGVAELVITHIANPFHLNPQPLVDDARRHFQGPISVARDLYQLAVGAG